jgi:CelD/BcsL family acetyltransferase involved in cellulose biosynthesis
VDYIIYETDPLRDARWRALVEKHPLSSVFHTVEWLEALQQTYDYTPIVLTTSPPDGPLTNGIVFCRVDSWLTGSRLVSLPFSDHCEPLVQNAADLTALLSEARNRTAGRLKYTEIRPRHAELPGLSPHAQYCLHLLDLQPPIEVLHSRLHKDGVQRKIRRAEREHVVLEQGHSQLQLEQFYQLLLLTRRRHRVPPQPFAWFQNLRECCGAKLTIRMAYLHGRPIASLLTLRHKQTIVYKYGCSDDQFHSLGAMPRLFWQAIEEAKSDQLQEFDLGRSDETNSGLIRFKDHLGANKTYIKYWRVSQKPSEPNHQGTLLSSSLAQTLFAHLPDRLFRFAGEILYRHVG